MNKQYCVDITVCASISSLRRAKKLVPQQYGHNSKNKCAKCICTCRDKNLSEKKQLICIVTLLKLHKYSISSPITENDEHKSYRKQIGRHD